MSIARPGRPATSKGRRCDGKLRDPTEQAARAHVERMVAAGAARGRLTVYPCGDHWHIGHTSKSKR